MIEKLTLPLVTLILVSLLSEDLRENYSSQDIGTQVLNSNKSIHRNSPSPDTRPVQIARTSPFVLFAEAKGVAGLGKAGGDGSSGADKAGQQVPPEVYNALTYAGTAFLLTLSVPLILYSLNKLLNRIEDCFGCGPSKRKAKRKEKALAAMAAAAEAGANQADRQPTQNQKLQQQEMQKQQSCKLPTHASFTSVDNNNNNNNPCNNNGSVSQSVEQQQQSMSLPPADFRGTGLQYNQESQYKISSSMLPNFQQPFMVSPQ